MEDLLYAIFPELQELGIGPDEVVEWMYQLRVVKNHGFGHVQITVTDHKVSKVEALIRTIHNREDEKKVNNPIPQI